VKNPIRAALLGAAALVLALAPLSAATAATAAPAHPAHGPLPGVGALPADSSTLTFDSFDVVYDLDRTGDGRSTLRVTETLVASFPEFDANHGILRVIPVTYDGHPLRLHVQSVTDGAGHGWHYDTEVDSENMVLKIGDADRYVHGHQTYVIAYTLENVTRYFPDTGDDEFYWDTNGLQWSTSFAEVSATVKLHDGLAELLQSTDCYRGASGSTDPCEITASDGTVSAHVSDLSAYQNMTIVLGFPQGTFAPADFNLFDYLPPGGVVGIVGTLGAAISAFVLRFTMLRNARGTGIIVAQYEPPSGMDPFLAANIVGAPKKGMAAAIMDLAVKRKLKIVERPGTGLFGGTDFGVQQTEPEAENTLHGSELTVMNALFSPFGGAFFSLRTPGLITLRNVTATATAPSEVRWLQKNDTVLGRQVVSITKNAALDAQRSGLRRKGGGVATLIVVGFVVLAGLGFIVTSISAQTEIAIAVGVIGINAIVWIGLGLIALVANRKPLTPEGAKLKEHLLGLKEFIRVAEADRLQMLQSVSGAERIDTDAGSVIKVYEKLLPYAVLFGLEKEWAGTLGKYYDQNPPDWYEGGNISAFNAGAFAAGVGSIASSVASSYSGSSSSSSSGGSGGGGSSGGGGGGGGGGGW
jgi:uncharacterized membrane protein YgcG